VNAFVSTRRFSRCIRRAAATVILCLAVTYPLTPCKGGLSGRLGGRTKGSSHGQLRIRSRPFVRRIAPHASPPRRGLGGGHPPPDSIDFRSTASRTAHGVFLFNAAPFAEQAEIGTL